MFVILVSLSLFVQIMDFKKLVEIEENYNKNIPEALEQLVEEMCKFNCNSGIYVLSSQSTTNGINFVIRSIEKLSFPIVIEDIKNVQTLRERRRIYTIVFVEKYEELESLFLKLNFHNFQLNGYFLLIFPNGSLDELNEIFTTLWRKFASNVNVVIDGNDEKLQIFTFMPFNNTCDNTKPVKINEFNGLKWKNNIFFPRKFFNLNGCNIRVGLFNLEPAIIVNGSHLSGFDVDIFRQIMDSINASVNFTIYPVLTGSILPNGTSTGLLGNTIRGEVDVSLRSFSNQIDRRKLLSDTMSYHSDTLIIVMPLSLPLNPLLKLFRPLSIEVWISLGVVILISLTIITLLKLIPHPYYFLIIGQKLRNYYLNILIGFIGLSQTKPPERSFLRFLFMMFLIFCLIIRSLYIGQMFNMLKKDLREREFTTIHDFYEAEFDFYIYETLAERLDYKEINKRRKIIKISEVEKYAMMTLNEEFRGVVFQYVTVALYTNQKNFREFTLKICKEPLMTNHLIFYFQKDFYLVDEVNEKIGLIRASGLNEYFVSRYADKSFRNVKTKTSISLQLKMQHFNGIFQLWIFGLTLSLLVFLFERFHDQVINKILQKRISRIG
jgi:hypothetical protein